MTTQEERITELERKVNFLIEINDISQKHFALIDDAISKLLELTKYHD